jgi:hypothetical protein
MKGEKGKEGEMKERCVENERRKRRGRWKGIKGWRERKLNDRKEYREIS